MPTQAKEQTTKIDFLKKLFSGWFNKKSPLSSPTRFGLLMGFVDGQLRGFIDWSYQESSYQHRNSEELKL